MKISKRKAVCPHTNKPRNPLVATALLRKAGNHRPNNKARRAQHKHDARRAIREADSHD